VLSQPLCVLCFKLGPHRFELQLWLRTGPAIPPDVLLLKLLLLAMLWLLLLLLLVCEMGGCMLLLQACLLLALFPPCCCAAWLRPQLQGGTTLGRGQRRFARLRHIRAELWHASRGLRSRRQSSRAAQVGAEDAGAAWQSSTCSARSCCQSIFSFDRNESS
jgi:hypothetical protein